MEKEIPADIKEFLKNMLYLADEFNYGEPIPDGLMWELYTKLNEQISAYMLAKLSSEKLTEYRVLKEKNDPPEQLEVYLMKNIPDYKETMKKAYRDFYDSYIEQAHQNRPG